MVNMERIEHLDETTKKVREFRSKVIKEIKERSDRDSTSVVMEACFQWARDIKEKHPDTYTKVRSYYAMIGGTPPEERVSENDFSGEDSAFLFLENLRKRLLGPKSI